MSTSPTRFTISTESDGEAVIAVHTSTYGPRQENVRMIQSELADLSRSVDAYLRDPRAALIHRAPELYLYADPDGEATLELRGASDLGRYNVLTLAELQQLGAALNEYLTQPKE